MKQTPTDTPDRCRQALSDAVNAHTWAVLALSHGDKQGARAMWLLREAHIQLLAGHREQTTSIVRAEVLLEHRRTLTQPSTV